MKKYYLAKRIILGNESIDSAYLVVEKDKFKGVVKDIPKGTPYMDYSDYVIAPGFVDTHIHGYASYDVMDNDKKGLEMIAEGLLECGVTSWLATSLTAEAEYLEKICHTVSKNVNNQKGARIQGLFFEGPFFTEKHKGAQNSKYMMDPSVEWLHRWYRASDGLLRKIALAPERQGVKEFIQEANTLGVKTAIGHSNATYDQAKKAVNAGASLVVHTYNGMSGLHHREPGMVGAALTLPDVYAELVCDGFHVHPAAVEVAIKARGVDSIVLITDCMRAGGMESGQYMLGEYPVEVSDGAARLVYGGNLAGSILKLKDAVRNLVTWGIVTLDEAVKMATWNAAHSVGLNQVCGQIAPDYKADFVVLDINGDLIATYLSGMKRYAINK